MEYNEKATPFYGMHSVPTKMQDTAILRFLTAAARAYISIHVN